MSNEIAVQQSAEVSPMQLIAQASKAGASIEQMQQLFELKLRVDADEARRAYNKAFTAFKAEAVAIVKGTSVKAGPLAGTKYANLFDVVNAVIPALSRHGLSHSWKLTKDERDWMEVTCTIHHSLGHSESVSIGAAPDEGAGRNKIQARCSAITYLERYTLLAATGMAASDADDDGQGGGNGKPRMSADDLHYAIENIENASTPAELKTIYEAAYKSAKEIGDRAAMGKIVDAKDKRKGGM